MLGAASRAETEHPKKEQVCMSPNLQLLPVGWEPYLVGDYVAMTHWMMKRFAEGLCRWYSLESIPLGAEGSDPWKGATPWKLLENFPQEWCIGRSASGVLEEAAHGDVSGCHMLQESSRWEHQNREESPLSRAVTVSAPYWQTLTLCQMAKEKRLQGPAPLAQGRSLSMELDLRGNKLITGTTGFEKLFSRIY